MIHPPAPTADRRRWATGIQIAYFDLGCVILAVERAGVTDARMGLLEGLQRRAAVDVFAAEVPEWQGPSPKATRFYQFPVALAMISIPSARWIWEILHHQKGVWPDLFGDNSPRRSGVDTP